MSNEGDSVPVRLQLLLQPTKQEPTRTSQRYDQSPRILSSVDQTGIATVSRPGRTKQSTTLRFQRQRPAGPRKTTEALSSENLVAVIIETGRRGMGGERQPERCRHHSSAETDRPHNRFQGPTHVLLIAAARNPPLNSRHCHGI